MPLLIQKSVAKNYVAANSKIDSDGGVISDFTYFFRVFTFSPPHINFILEIKGTRIDSASKFLEQIPR